MAGTRIKQVNCNTDGNLGDIIWSSTNPSVAVVEPYGYVRAYAVGTTNVTGKLDGFTINCTITVTSSSSTNISLYRIDFDIYEKIIDIGETFKINIIYVPSNTTDDRTATWTSSDESVARVDNQGNVTGVSSGKATIRAIVGNRARSCTVTVSDSSVPITGITMSQNKMTVAKGSNSQLTVSFVPSNATQDRTIIWSTTENTVATVSQDGRVYGIGTGVVIIKATSTSGYEAACTVTVVDSSYSIAITQSNLMINEGSSGTLSVRFTPDEFGDESLVQWYSSNNDVATVSGGVVTAVGAGDAIITAEYSGYSDTCTVQVLAPLSSISLNKSSATINEDGGVQLLVYYKPTNTTDSKSVSWSSSNNNVATVSSSGYVSAVSSGNAIITANCNGKITTCNITVNTLSRSVIRQFVTRMYTIVLNRSPETVGMDAWTEYLYNAQCTGAQMLQAFIEGDEFVARGLSDNAFMDVMYRAVMGREPDTEGMEAWLTALSNGVSRTYVLSGFTGSTEFTDICNDYGITKGNVVTTEGRDRNYKVTCFVQRFYTKVLNREAEVEGLNVWCNAIIDKNTTPQNAARLFVFSDEAINRNLSNAEYIKMLYRTFMGRECESDEILNGWVGYISTQGHTRDEAFELFAGSTEFADIVRSYGL